MKDKNKKQKLVIVKENIVDRNLAEFCKEIITLFGANINIARSVPDRKDDLKPSARRVLYGMFMLGLLPNRPNKKSARIVGEILGKYHPLIMGMNKLF